MHGYLIQKGNITDLFCLIPGIYLYSLRSHHRYPLLLSLFSQSFSNSHKETNQLPRCAFHPCHHKFKPGIITAHKCSILNERFFPLSLRRCSHSVNQSAIPTLAQMHGRSRRLHTVLHTELSYLRLPRILFLENESMNTVCLRKSGMSTVMKFEKVLIV